MSYPGDEPELDAVCEFLGLSDDADSHATYPTEAHRCYRLERPTRIATTHQETYCLGPDHVSCPVFRGEGVAQTTRTASPPPSRPRGRDPEAAGAVRGPERGARQQQQRRPQRPPRQAGTLRPRPRSGGISMPAATIGLLGLAIAIVGLAFLVQRILGDDDNTTLPGDTLATQQAIEEETAAAGGGDEPTPGGEDEPTAPPEDENGNGDGEDEEPGGEPTAPADEEEPPAGSTTYTVEGGDTCFALAQEFDTTVDAIINANGLDANCSLSVGQTLTIP